MWTHLLRRWGASRRRGIVRVAGSRLSNWSSRDLAVIVLATALVTVTFVTPLTTLPRTIADLGGGPEAQAWVLSAMSVGLAGGLLAVGDVGDVHGRRRMFSLGLSAVGVGALVCVVAPGVGWFIAARLIQGVGGAAVLSCGLALLAHEYRNPTERAYVTGLWGAGVGGGIAAGSLLAAGLDLGADWRAPYVLVFVATVALIAATFRWVPESRSATDRTVDLTGGILLAIAMAAAVGALTETRTEFGLTGVGLGLLAVLSLGAFAGQEARASAPVLDLHTLKQARFQAATVGSLVLGAGMIGMAAFVPTMVQRGLDGTVWTGSVLVAVWAGVGVMTSVGIRHLPRPLAGPRHLSVLLVGLTAGQVTALGLSPASTPWRLIPAMALAGVATGALNALLGRESVASVAPDRAAMGSGANNAARYLGAAIGITIFAVISGGGDMARAADVMHGWNVAVTVAAALTATGAAVVGLLARRG